jgi:type IV secretion system protein VirB9
MKPLFGAFVLIAAALASPIMAAEVPTPGLLDPRIRTVFYNPDQVVLLKAYFGYQMMLEFGPDERIENVSIGDGVAWQVTPNKKATLLFLKPVEKAAPTNMTVVTDQRRYAFQLVSSARGGDRAPDMAYVVRFIYPPAPRPPAVAKLEAPSPPERRNILYTYTGSRVLLPSLVFDDGRFTYFQWPEGVSDSGFVCDSAGRRRELGQLHGPRRLSGCGANGGKICPSRRQGGHHGDQRRLAATGARRFGAAAP